MTKRLSVVILALVLGVSALSAGKGKVRIASDKEGAYIYVDGKKKAMTGEGFTSILIEEGEHTVKVIKSIDDLSFYIKERNIFVGVDSSVKLVFTLEKILTEKGKLQKKREEELQKKREEEEERKRQKKHEAKYGHFKRKGSIVTDTKLGLMWQDNSAAKSYQKEWKAARKYCQNLSFSGYLDWRLPSYDELLSIVDKDRHDPAINPTFKNIGRTYWSSTTNASKTTNVWFVDFYDGSGGNLNKLSTFYIRCVRSRR